MQSIINTTIHYNNKKIKLNHFDNEHISNIIRKNKVFYEFGMLKYIHNNTKINKEKTFVDIGANIGNHSTFFATISNKVIAFEPITENYDVLLKNKIDNNLNNLIIYNVGIGEATGKYSAKLCLNNMGSSVIEKNENGSIMVDKPDNYLQNEDIGLIKIDVEDMCISVIKSLVEIIAKHKPHLFVEANDTELAYISKLLNYKPIRKFNATPTYHMTPN